MYFSQQAIYHQMETADLSFAMVETAPNRLVLKLSWDNERSACSAFTLWKKKSPLWQYSANREAGRIVFIPWELLKSSTEAVWTGVSSLHRNQSRDNKTDLIGCIDEPSTHKPTTWHFDPHYSSTRQTVCCDILLLCHSVSRWTDCPSTRNCDIPT
jgi:hypothetical protein